MSKICGYGVYQGSAWIRSAAQTRVQIRMAETDDRSGMETLVFPMLGNFRVVVPPGFGRTLGLYSGPRVDAGGADIVEVLTEVAERARADAIFLPGMWAEDADSVMDAVEAKGNNWRALRRSDGVAAVQLIGEDLEATIGLVPKSERKPLRRRFRKLESEEGVEVRTVQDPVEVGELFPEFVRLHNLEWRSRGKQGHYVDWPEAAATHRALIDSSGPGLACAISGVWLNGEPVAMQLGFVGDGLASAVNLARNPGLRCLDHLSPATVAFFEFAGFAGRAGAKMIELGRGSYEYKRRLGAEENELTRLLIFRNQLLPRVKTRLSLEASKALNLLYYRLWFVKVSSRLGVRPGSLWRSWRTRS